MRFEKQEDCYLDIRTGLEWSLETIGQHDWQSAIKCCEDLGSEWRLPTIQELLTLINYYKYNPATDLPDMVLSYYWSSTTYANYTYYAWFVHFGHGYGGCSSKSNFYYVRAVRSL